MRNARRKAEPVMSNGPRKKPGSRSGSLMSAPASQQFVAFLRGINVGGKNQIRMKDLAALLTAAGLKNVRTVIASGNVLFDSSSKDTRRLARFIERHLRPGYGEISVIVRSVDDIRRLIRRNPFKRTATSEDVMKFVVLMAAEPPVKPRLPVRSTSDNMDVIALAGGAAFVLARRKKTGWFGFPNNFIEKQFRVTATTRNYSTLVRIVDLCSGRDSTFKVI